MQILSAFFGRKWAVAGLVVLCVALGARAADNSEAKPSDPYLDAFHLPQAPAPEGLLLHEDDRLAICGDSITEQKMYSNIIETYLTVCTPQLRITARQYGWSGETAGGFLGRMDSDCLRFHPTIATLCYGMNDFRYLKLDEAIAQDYRKNYTAVVEKFKAAGVRVVLGSPGCITTVPPWAVKNHVTKQDLNLSLCAYRNIDIEIARDEQVRFADVFAPMLVEDFETRNYPNFSLTNEGVHPKWPGHVIMAYAFLHAMGLDGKIGTFTVDLPSKHAEASAGHHVDQFDGKVLTITSHRYPFCVEGDVHKDDCLRSGMALVPFNQELNRLTLVVHGPAASYKITWGNESHTYPAADLANGINLAADFASSPFYGAFNNVKQTVAEKQNYETKQIKELFRSPEAHKDMAAVVEKSEAERAPLAAAIVTAFVPVTHTIEIEPQ